MSQMFLDIKSLPDSVIAKMSDNSTTHLSEEALKIDKSVVFFDLENFPTYGDHRYQKISGWGNTNIDMIRYLKLWQNVLQKDFAPLFADGSHGRFAENLAFKDAQSGKTWTMKSPSIRCRAVHEFLGIKLNFEQHSHFTEASDEDEFDFIATMGGSSYVWPYAALATEWPFFGGLPKRKMPESIKRSL